MLKKKILLYTRPIAPLWDEASKNLAFDIAVNMPKSQFDVALLTPKKNPFNTELIKKYPGVKPEEIYSSANLNLKGKLELLGRLFRIKLNTDLIHFLFTPRSITSLLVRLRLRFSQVKTVQTVATVSKKNLSNPKKLNKILFANVIIAQSKHTFKKLTDSGIKKARLIYPGINLEKYQPRAKDPRTLEKLKLKSSDFIVLYGGEYTRLKAIDDILDSMKILFNEYKDVKNLKFIFACRLKSKKDQIKKEAVIKALEKESLRDKVVLLDAFDELDKLYNLSDIGIFPVREMAGKFDIPLVLVESMACGKPIIVSKLKNLKEVVGNDAHGLICKRKSPQDLAEKIHLLKTDKKLYTRIARDALAFVRNNFDIKKNVKEYNTVYEELLKD